MQWRRIIGWTVAVLGILILSGFVGGYLFLKSRSFQQYAIRTIVQDTNDATGGRAEIGNFDFQLSTLTARLYNITLHGKERPDEPALAQVDKLTLGIKIQSLRQRKFTLNELLVEHPVIHLLVDRKGKSNMPQSPPSQNGSTSVFDLAVGRLLLSKGEINYNDKKIPLEADLHNLGTEIRFDSLSKSYRGSVSYDNGQLRYADYSPLPHNLNVRFSATPSRFSLDSAALRVGSSDLSLRAELVNYSDPKVDGDYDIRIHTQDLSSMSPTITPAGDVSLSGKIHYQESKEPLLRSVSIDGQIASQALAVLSSKGHLEFRQIQGQYRLSKGTFEAHSISAESLGGKVSVDADVQHLDSAAMFRVRTSLIGISLQSAEQAVRRPELKSVALSGRLDGMADAFWTGSVSNIRVGSDLRLQAAAADRTNRSAGGVPVDGAIHMTYDGPRDVITFRQTTLQIPSTSLMVQGEVSKHSNLQVQVTSSDLHQLASLLSAFRADPSNMPEVSGSAAFNGLMQGSAQSPHLIGQLSAQNLEVQGSQWNSARIAVDAGPSQIVLRNGSLVNARQGNATFSGNVGLQNWTYLPSNPIAVRLSAKQLSVTDLQRLANLHYPISGDLFADVSLDGSELDPVGAGSLRILNARVSDEPVQNLGLKLHAEKGSLTSTLDVGLPAGTITGNVSYTPKTKAYALRLNAPSVMLQKLYAVQQKNLPLTGTVTASASGEGTLDNPQLTANLEVPQLQFRRNSISGVKAEVHVVNQHAELTLNSQVAQASVQAHGTVNLTGDYLSEASIDTKLVPLDLLLATYLPSLPEGFQGQTEFHASLKGPLKDKSRLEAHLTIPALNANYQSLQIAATGPIRVDYAQSVVTLQPAEIRGTDTSLRVEGVVPLGGTTTANLRTQGSVDARLLSIAQADLHSSGIVTFDIRASGPASNPAVQGQVHLQDLALSTTDAPLGIEKLNGTLDVSHDQLRISNLTGQVGGGDVSLAGSINYRPTLQFNVALRARSVRLRYPEGLRTVLDSNLALVGTTQGSTLNGRVLIDNLSFTPDFDLAKFSDQFGGTAAPPQPGIADTVKLAIGVQSKDQLSATSSQASLEGNVNLQVIGTAANPVITGRTNLTSGEFFYRNVRYQLQRGIISFDNPNLTEPVMNVSVNATVEQYNLTLTLRGAFDKLTVSYVSEPPLATADIINLLASGKTTQEGNATSPSTDSIIASQAAGQVSSGVQKLAGISSLQIDPLIGGNNANPSARIAIQHRVTKNFLFTFSTDVSQPGNEIVQGDYQINKRWSVSVARDQVGGISADGRYHTRF
jgi:translocation and assembly module TamB